MNDEELTKLKRVHEAFTPSSPISSKTLFAGRAQQITALVKAFGEPGQHAALFGERGVGKTSLSNIFSAVVRSLEWTVIGVSCDASDNFSTIWQRALQQIPISIPRQGIGFGSEASETSISAAQLMISGKVQAAFLAQQMKGLGLRALVVFDEFDQVKDQPSLSEMASLLKILSDTHQFVKILVVGVAGDVLQLVNNHQSVERCLKQVFLPRMSEPELHEIVSKGAELAGLVFDEDVVNHIISISQGFPHYTHLLAKHAGIRAISALPSRTEVEMEHLEQAIEDSIADTSGTIRGEYKRATVSVNEALYKDVLLACALVECDDEVAFRPKDLEGPISRVLGRVTPLQSFFPHLGKLCQPERAQVLERLGNSKPFRYRFRNPLMRPFVLMMGQQQGHDISSLMSNSELSRIDSEREE